jgi:protocatechuate 3,4-dioxygenase beta subunit
MARLGLLVALFLQAAAGVTSQAGSILGRVTDQASGQALPRMVVTLYGGDPARSVETITDADGRYRFDGLPPGKYAVAAANDNHHATYLRQWFGRPDPADPNDLPPSPAIEMADGESRTDIDLALTHALAIEGRVLDQLGEPLNHVGVSASSARGVQVRSAPSNDLGAYRIFGLRPGRYRVCADQQTCYPDILLTSQDALNIDLLKQSSDASPAPSIDAVASQQTDQATGSLRGLVRDNQSGRPLAHATVHLGYRGSERPPSNLAAVTGEDGAFTLSGLPAGPYVGFATATGHILSKLSDGSNSDELVVRKGEVLQVAVTLGRACAINVRLVDPFDAPVSDVGITLQTTVDGRALTLPIGSSDDLGHVRVSGLAPGRYVICAEPPDRGSTARSVQQHKRVQLQRTCYGSTLGEAGAQPVVVGNADIDDLELRLVSGRALSISGTILDSTGAPAPHAVVGFAKYVGEGTSTNGLEVRPDGHFRIVNVPPGAYAIEATTDREGAFVPLRVTEEDVEDLVVSMQKTAKVTGRITVDDRAAVLPAEARRAPMLLSARLADERLAGDGGSLSATVDSHGTFVLDGLFGRRRIDVTNVPSGWYVKAVRYAGTDVLGTPAVFKDGQSLEIVLSNRGATISGTVAEIADGRGGQALVLLFRAPADEQDLSRLVSSVLSVTGNYSFGPLREGEYIVIAVPGDVPIPLRGDWDRIGAIAASSEHVTVGDLDSRSIELHVTAVR